MMRLASRLYPELGLYVLKLSGVFTAKDLVIKMETLFKDPDYDPHKYCLIDIRQTCLLLCEKEIKRYGHYFEGKYTLDTCRYVAILGERPQHTAVSILYQMYNNSLFYRLDIFNTPEAGLHWLEIEPKDYSAVLSFLNE